MGGRWQQRLVCGWTVQGTQAGMPVRGPNMLDCWLETRFCSVSASNMTSCSLEWPSSEPRYRGVTWCHWRYRGVTQGDRTPIARRAWEVGGVWRAPWSLRETSANGRRRTTSARRHPRRRRLEEAHARERRALPLRHIDARRDLRAASGDSLTTHPPLCVFLSPEGDEQRPLRRCEPRSVRFAALGAGGGGWPPPDAVDRRRNVEQRQI
ncbi:hypothetical protein C8Q77DRAFT_1142399 [Trametes polyzona]|nr:hypothetical protein C8Q77DRAFT_1142399 [Trametes polyzona]